MTKQLQTNESPFSMAFNEELLSAGRARADAMMKANTELLKQVEGLQRSLLDSIQQAAGATTDFTQRASRCGNPGEVAALYNEWLTQRMEAAFAESRRFAEMWLKMFDAVAMPLKAGGGTGAAKQPAQTIREAAPKPAQAARA